MCIRDSTKVAPMYRLPCLTLLCEACVDLGDGIRARSFLERAERVNAALTLPKGSLASRLVDRARELCERLPPAESLPDDRAS